MNKENMNRENPVCIYCKKQKTIFFLEVGGFKYFKCRDCHLVFLSPQPNKNKLLFLNKQMYGKKNKIEEYFKRETYYRLISKKILGEIKQYKKNGKILDLGCFCGLFLDEARKGGFDVLGVEIEKEAVKYARAYFNLQVLNKEFSKIEISDQFDAVTLIDVLEHLINLRSVLIKIRKLLVDGGILFIQCPNIESLVFKLTKDKWNWLLPGIHLYQFSPESLKKILGENGFEVLSIKTHDDISEFVYNIIDVLGIKKRNLIEKIIWKWWRITLLVIFRLFHPWGYFGWGGAINLLAKKSSA